MSQQERFLRELPGQRKGWERVRVVEGTMDEIDQFISTLVNFGESLIEETGKRLPGMPVSPFFVRVSAKGIEDFTLSVSLPSSQEDKSSVVIRDNRRSPAIRAIEMMRMGKDEIGLRARGRDSGRRIENSEEIKGVILKYLEANQIIVEVGRLVLLDSYAGDKTWQTLGSEILELESPNSKASRKKREKSKENHRGQCSYCGKPGAEKVSNGVYFHRSCPREVRRIRT
jgi:hypothetical protein